MVRIGKERFIYRNECFMGFCNVEVFLDKDQQIVVFTEIPSNPGPSVTNAIEYIISQFCKAKELVQSDIIFIERYAIHPDELDVVTVNNGIPHWSRLPTMEAQPILFALGN